MKNLNNIAVIFDLDGTILDNKHFHIKAWVEFLNTQGISITIEDFTNKGFGGSNKEYLSYFLKREISDEDDKILGELKEKIYREIYAPQFKPINGFNELIDNLKKNKIKIAMATMAPKSNVDFTLNKLKNPEIFDAIIDYYMVKNGKPHPDIYLKASELLNIQPENCIVIEDSFIGIESAKNANMKVIGIETYHSAKELKDADFTIKDFTELRIEDVLKLVQ
ncbi:HAD family hydrolase [Bacteroidota bacterium]